MSEYAVPLMVGPVVLYLAVTLFVEATVLYYFRVKSFGRCLGDAVVANVVSAITAIGLLAPVGEFARYVYGNVLVPRRMLMLFLIFLSIIIAEWLILWLRNRTVAQTRLLAATFIMNLVTYGTLWLIILSTEQK
ncbi:MAG TPA: hypothetical protein VEB86_01740 [Chryseosolibacter sp.]|nr:hypothetical protein [Chryseosolibacter sp.]